MTLYRTTANFFVLILLLAFSISGSDAFQATVLPSEIKTGDAFLVKVEGEELLELPSAAFNKRKLHFSSCGNGCYVSVGAIDINTKPGTYKISMKVGKNSVDVPLIVTQASFPEIHLTLPKEKVFPSPENQKRIRREAEKLNAIWPQSTERLWDGNFILPLENDISTVFGVKRIFNNKKNSLHRGMDIRGKHGEEVKASNNGKVVLAEDLFFGGNTVILDHGQGIYSIYMHLSKFKVKQEDVVSRGDIIGLVGSTGRATGPHLHFGVKVLNTNTNPLSIVELEL